MSTDDTTSQSITAPDAVLTKLPQTVEIKAAGPCKKHVKVTVDRAAIDTRFDEKYSELVLSDRSSVSGFRPGKAPRKIIEKRYKKEVAADIKTEILMASLEQLADEQQISPLAPPELDPKTIEIPETGPFIYEFDIEVRPEFDLPEYKGLKLRRPTHIFNDADVAKETRKVLEPFGQITPKTDVDGKPAMVEMFDIITAHLTIVQAGKELNKVDEIQIKVEPQLALADGVAKGFGKAMIGAKVGDARTVDILLSQEIANPSLRGTTVQATFKIIDMKAVKLQELDDRLLGYFGLKTREQFDELIRVRLDRSLDNTQRQMARQQVLEQLGKGAKLELPQDLLRRQARKTLARKVMDMRSNGMTDEEIGGRQRLLEMDVLKNTASALQEHFVLQKIAELEKIEIEDADIEREIENIADRQDEPYRKVRARMEKEDLIEALATELLERRALDLVLESATYEDYELNPSDAQEDAVSTSSTSSLTEDDAKAPDESTPANS